MVYLNVLETMYILDTDMECLPRAYSYFDDEEFCQSLLKDLQQVARSPSVKTGLVSDVPQVDECEEAETSWNCSFSPSDDDDDASLSYSSSSEDDTEDDTEEDTEGDMEEDVEEDVKEDVEENVEEDVEEDVEKEVEKDMEEDVEENLEDTKGVPTSEEKSAPSDEDVESPEDYQEPVASQETDDYTSDYCSSGDGSSSESEEIDVVSIGQRPLPPTPLLLEIQQQHNYAAPPPKSRPQRHHVHMARTSSSHADSHDRRQTHTALERKRRDEMRIYFWRLRDSIPELRGNNRAPKIIILNRARDLIRDLEARAYRLGAMRYALRAKRKEMRERLAYFTGAPLS
ncbi:uncharacterized protein LOC144203463 [Stigmatopora nigra]